MSVTYKDINNYSQKQAIDGTEKIPVSDTDYITPTQIIGLSPSIYSGTSAPSSSLGVDGDIYIQTSS